MNKHNLEAGVINPLLIASILLGVLAASFAGGFIWAYGNYQKYEKNTNEIVSEEVNKAREEQKVEDEKKFVEREKQPYLQLVGPEDLGKVTISYPKTWSVYIAKSTSSGYEAYLNPVTVPTVSGSQPYAARVTVSEQKYETAVTSFNGLVKKGDLKSTPVTVNNFNGIRLDGKFSATRSGSMVVFKVRDKTLTVATDIDSFKSDFDDIIVKSLDFNP